MDRKREASNAEVLLGEVVRAVCRLPIDYESMETLSAIELVGRSGYAGRRSQITVDLLQACLEEHPEWVQAWFDWSADNRSTPAWYVMEAEPGTFVLGFYEGPGSQPEATFSDKPRAAAAFAIRYLDQVDAIRERGPTP